MKRKVTFPKLMSLILLLLFSTALAPAQVEPTDEMPEPKAERPRQERQNLFRELGLLPEQIQQVRRINMETKPLMETAQRRLREANRNLDIAIYTDGARSADVELKLIEFQAAQAEIARLRFMKEFAVRKVLTPEQLTRFRDLRKRFAESRKEIEERRGGQNERPIFRRMNRRVRPVVNE